MVLVFHDILLKNWFCQIKWQTLKKIIDKLFKEIIPIINSNLSIFKKKTILIYIYNKIYCCFLKISKNFKIKLLTSTTLEVVGICKNTTSIISKYIQQFYFCNFTKIKFTGKGYKIKKNNKKSIILLFNRAHITIMWWNNIIVKRLKKYKIYIKYTNKTRKIVELLLNIRPINIFTKKGLRKSRQILFKKKGKK